MTLAEKWWAVRKGPGSLVRVYYTEESKEEVKEKHIHKQLRGGTAVSVADGKQCMIEGMQSGWNKGMLGLEDSASDEEEPEMAAVAVYSGIGSSLKPVAPTAPDNPHTNDVKLTKKQKQEAAQQDKIAAKLAIKEQKLAAKEAKAAARQKEIEEEVAQADAAASAQAKQVAVHPPDLFMLYASDDWAIVLG